MKKLYFIINGLHKQSGGVPKTTIKRANFLVENFDCQVTLFTLNYQKDFDEILEQFYAEGKINKKVKVISLLNSYYDDISPEKSNKLLERINKLFENKKKKKKMNKIYDNKNKLRAIKENEEGNTYMFTICKNGKKLLKINVENKKWKNITIIKNGKYFENMQSFYKYTLENLVESNEDNIITSDFRDKGLDYLPGGGLDEVVGSLSVKIRKIGFIHTNHLKDKENINILNPEFKKLFENKNFCKYVVLTKEQKDDILDVYQNLDIQVISNIVTFDKNVNKQTTRRDKMLYYGRYEKVKNIPEMIEIFNLVIKEVPTFEFTLYGHGSQKKEIQKLVLHPNINICGIIDTEELQSVIRANSFLLSTSKYEGQQLTLLEAFANELPFFTYPFKYGSKDITLPYDNGVMTNKRDKKEMANLIINYINGEFDFENKTKYSNMYNLDKIKIEYKKLLYN